MAAGFIKGKSAIHLTPVYGERSRNFVGQHFRARGYFVSTLWRDEELIRGSTSGTKKRKTGVWTS